MKTKTYTFIIGSADDFESLDELIDYVEANGNRGFRDYTTYELDVPVAANRETMIMIGRGVAFSNGWSMDDTFSTGVEGALETEAEKAAVDAGIEAREVSKTDRSEQQQVDLYGEWNANDPRNW